MLRIAGASIRCMKNILARIPAQSAAVLLAAGVALLSCVSLHAQEPVKVPMTADRWETKGTAEFTQQDGLAVAKVTKGVAILKDFNFRNGTIEFDVSPLGSMGAGIGFRRRDDQTYEDFYLRPRPACDKAVDCMQYAPETHGVLLWDVFPQYQSPAPLKDGTWNHIKLVISGQRMNIYVNGATSPTLAVPRLEGDTLEGGVLLQGPGMFANLTIAPDAVDGLTPEPAADASASDPHIVRKWQLSPWTTLEASKEPAYSDLPAASAQWTSIEAEREGLVNISRVDGLPTDRKTRTLAWIKTSITSKHAQTTQVDFGWVREAWVFVNGKLIYADKNMYMPETARKKPDGRLSLENGSFALPLKAGKNEIAIAVASQFYGWGVKMRLADTKGIELAEQWAQQPASAKQGQ